ncbi:xylose isomerase [Telmatocola sphagniphila]|uniref:Xylose isomerase n=1 Tax=Telmatocola sphagniphila TaxID=1123043 RepID=A0A8E6B3C0_9BACT|nr:xylose isomerase [Telmatocola sphagniphila]QVL30549.1 xylose isomerase [Telmatocola sphagniphila]
MPYFPEVSKIAYEGPDSRNPLAFRHYNEAEIIDGKSMKDHLRFAVCYWHTFRGTGSDPFGPGCAVRPWEDGTDSVEMAVKRVRVAFEFMEKLGAPYYCFHDRDVSPEGKNLAETNKNLDVVVKALKEEQQRTGIQLLWGTANLFSNPRFVHGASTSPNADVFAYSAAQVKKAMEVTKELGGVNYVFWGGREGYMNLYNTNLRRELDHLGRFLSLAVDYKKKIGFTGQFLIEPKPKEPTTHQYDTDCAACMAFLRTYGLEKDFKFNIETNHATLAGHTMLHEMTYASSYGMLGSLDANRGDLLLGWDTDQFPTDLYLTAQCMLVILEQGGLGSGGLNFDAKVRRESFEPIDLFHAHIGSMDAFAQGLKIAAAIRKDGLLKNFVKERYSSWDSGIGADIEAGKAKFEELEKYMLEKGDSAKNVSGRQEMLENIINRYIR